MSGHPEARCLFSVLIITYNRAHVLGRALESIEAQGCDDLEVLVMDDGSTDGTERLVRAWARRVPFEVRYLWQPNRGKPAAYNAALSELRGYFTVVLDADDALAPGALETFHRAWQAIPAERRKGFAGVEGLCADWHTGRILGDPFPFSPMDADYLETRYRFKVSGDKKQALRTDVMRAYPFPLFPGERDMRESVVWCRMAHRYVWRCINEVVQYCEQLSDGLSAQPHARRRGSPQGFRLAFLELLNLHDRYLTRRDIHRAMVRYVRHSLVAGIGPLHQIRDLAPGKRPFWPLAFPEGLLGALKDRMRT